MNDPFMNIFPELIFTVRSGLSTANNKTTFSTAPWEQNSLPWRDLLFPVSCRMPRRDANSSLLLLIPGKHWHCNLGVESIEKMCGH